MCAWVYIKWTCPKDGLTYYYSLIIIPLMKGTGNIVHIADTKESSEQNHILRIRNVECIHKHMQNGYTQGNNQWYSIGHNKFEVL